MRQKRLQNSGKRFAVRSVLSISAAVAALFCAGCAASPQPSISVTLDIWDCRGDRPKRLEDSGIMTPNFAGLKLPQNGNSLNNPPENSPEKTP